jgi:hypothetical protein
VNDDAQKMIHKLLELKLKAYDDFLNITQRLSRFLDNQEMDEVNGLIVRREDVMKIIDDLDKRIFTFRSQYRRDMNPSFIRHVEKVFADINAKIRQLIQANDNCCCIAAGQCVALQEALNTSRREETGFRKYSGKPQLLPKFLDVQT